MARILGQILGFLIIFSIIYFPFIKPLTILNSGGIVIRGQLNESQLSKQKSFSRGITLYHLLLSLFAFIFVIIETFKKREVLGESFVTEGDFLVIGILGTIALCFAVTLYLLLNKKNNKENLLKLVFILPIHCIIGILSSFLLGIHLFFNINQKAIGILILSMLLIEIIYIISLYRFQKQTGVVWEKPKSRMTNNKEMDIPIAKNEPAETDLFNDTFKNVDYINETSQKFKLKAPKSQAFAKQADTKSTESPQPDYHNTIYWVMAILLAILFLALLVNNYIWSFV